MMMSDFKRLEAQQLRPSCDPRQFKFKSTADLKVNHDIFGQDRAINAIKFALSINRPGYNVYALGASGTGKYSIILSLLKKEAGNYEVPNDWCYVYNFLEPRKPIALKLPPGTGKNLQADMNDLIASISPLKVNLDQLLNTSEEILTNLKEKYRLLPNVIIYLEAVATDIKNNAHELINSNSADTFHRSEGCKIEEGSFIRYQVNVMVSHQQNHGAPIVYESLPTYHNLVGRVEQMTISGTITTNFSLIRPGKLHLANGGFLIIDANKLLSDSNTWEYLKKALFSHSIEFDPIQVEGFSSTISLEPESIPLDIRVILLGDRSTYSNVCDDDPDFKKLFKVVAEFQYEIPRNKKNNQMYAKLIAKIANNDNLLPFDRNAVASIIEQSARIANDAEKLSVHIQCIADLLREADHQAKLVGHKIVKKTDVVNAINEQIRRVDRSRESHYEDIERKFVLIDTEGKQIGQVNALTVLDNPDFEYGEPSRISAVARNGKNEMIDIEREVDLGGSIHSKGVLILTGYIHGKYAPDVNLSFYASLAFEQNYSHVDGDSASVAELAALLSSLANVPIDQAIAVTGSVNQFGEVQSVGALNAKIEGFYDVCRRRGLTGTQGVIIPSSNVANLMLRLDVVKAAEKKKFHIYPVEHIDQVMYILTGIEPGEKNKRGNFPKKSLNYRIEKTLKAYSESPKEDDKD